MIDLWYDILYFLCTVLLYSLIYFVLWRSIFRHNFYIWFMLFFFLFMQTTYTYFCAKNLLIRIVRGNETYRISINKSSRTMLLNILKKKWKNLHLCIRKRNEQNYHVIFLWKWKKSVQFLFVEIHSSVRTCKITCDLCFSNAIYQTAKQEKKIVGK